MRKHTCATSQTSKTTLPRMQNDPRQCGEELSGDADTSTCMRHNDVSGSVSKRRRRRRLFACHPARRVRSLQSSDPSQLHRTTIIFQFLLPLPDFNRKTCSAADPRVHTSLEAPHARAARLGWTPAVSHEQQHTRTSLSCTTERERSRSGGEIPRGAQSRQTTSEKSHVFECKTTRRSVVLSP